MTFFKTHKCIIHEYLVYNQILRRVNQVDDLGVRLVPLLSFNNHIEYITCKALPTQGSKYRPSCLTAIYTSLVRSILEYGLVVCSPYTQKNIERIESVQKRFFFFRRICFKS